MTCIAGYIDSNGIGHIASDSIGSNGHNKNVYKNSKIFKNGDFYMGYTSSYRMGQLLEHSFVAPTRREGQSVDSYIYVDFIEALRSLMKSNGFMGIDSNVESLGTFLIIYKGRIFKLQDDLAILEPIDNFITCGSGQDFAQATMHILTLNGETDGKKIVKTAIESACKYVATVGGKVNYMKCEQS